MACNFKLQNYLFSIVLDSDLASLSITLHCCGELEAKPDREQGEWLWHIVETSVSVLHNI